MKYVIDSSSLINLKFYYTDIFESFWENFNELVSTGTVISVREVFHEVLERDDFLSQWAKHNTSMFQTPSASEMEIVRKIMNAHKELVKQNSFKYGKPVADPFIIAKAVIEDSTVITEEKMIKGAHKIPNICEEFNVRSIPFYNFMKEQGWVF